MSISIQPPKLNELLRLNRERKRATLQMVHQDTRIAISYLQALESGEYDKFPAEVYCLGFLRKYAAYLGLDPDELAALYKKEQEAHVTVYREEEKKKQEAEKEEKSTDLVRVLSLVLFLAFVGGWWLLTVVKSPTEFKQASPLSQAQKKFLAAPLVRDELLSLQIHAASNVWIRVLPDKNLSFEGFVAAGSSRTWEAESEFSLRIGNVDEVNLTLNGQPVDVHAGAVKGVNEILLTRESLKGSPAPPSQETLARVRKPNPPAPETESTQEPADSSPSTE